MVGSADVDGTGVDDTTVDVDSTGGSPPPQAAIATRPGPSTATTQIRSEIPRRERVAELALPNVDPRIGMRGARVPSSPMETGSQRTGDHRPQRHLHLSNAFNVRDLGGYPVAAGGTTRWRCMYRADGLHRLDRTDVDELGGETWATIVDLRTRGEVDNWGAAPHEALGARWLHRPLIPSLWSEESLVPGHDPVAYLVERYHEMLDHGAGVFAEVVELLAEGDHAPLVFHCSAGKDRTGVTAALLLGLAGVDHDTIAADYHLTAAAMDEIAAWFRRAHPDSTDTMARQDHTFMAAPIEAMEVFLTELDAEHGSIEGYFSSIGVDGDAVEAYRAVVTQPAPG